MLKDTEYQKGQTLLVEVLLAVGVATWDPNANWSTGWHTVSTSDYSVTAGLPYTIKFETSGGDNDSTPEFMKMSVDKSSTSPDEPSHFKVSRTDNPDGYGQMEIRIR